MRNFTLLHFFILFLLSCTPSPVRHLQEVPPSQAFVENPYFSDAQKDYLYKAKVEVYGNMLGGILIIKKIADAHHRVVFTTEFGNKIFDFEFEGQDFKVNFVLENLDKKLIVNTLKRDFQLLLKPQAKVNKQFVTAKFTIYQAKQGRPYNFYYINMDGDQLFKIVHSARGNAKTIIEFDGLRASEAEAISIQHLNIKLRIDLQALSKKEKEN